MLHSAGITSMLHASDACVSQGAQEECSIDQIRMSPPASKTTILTGHNLEMDTTLEYEIQAGVQACCYRWSNSRRHKEEDHPHHVLR